MKRKIFGIALSVCVISVIIAGEILGAKPGHDWAYIKVISYESGVTGFFDSHTGTMYMYDSNMQNCYAVRQIIKLGDPMRIITNRAAMSSSATSP